MLGRNPWPEKKSSGDAGSGEDDQDMAWEDTKISDHGFTATHDGVCNNLSLNNNILDDGDKESDDFLYGWGDTEDMDNMLR